MPSDHDIRVGIAAKVKLAAPLAVVFPWWCLGFDIPRWPGMLRSEDDSERAHGWVVTRRALDRTEANNGFFDTRATYAVWGFHYYATGNETANSEDLFQAELDAVAAALTPGAVSGVRLDPLQFPLIQIAKFGEELLHVGQGQIVAFWCG